MPTKGKSVGPGGRSTPMKKQPYSSQGPKGPAGSNNSTTTSRGYENSTGLRTNYKQSGSAKNAKAGK